MPTGSRGWKNEKLNTRNRQLRKNGNARKQRSWLVNDGTKWNRNERVSSRMRASRKSLGCSVKL
jgi:hypothetical protein